MSDVRRVLVFGETGAGKTSMVNTLTGQNCRVSSSAVGCTFETTYYTPVRLGGYLYEFIDTVGLNEGSAGTVKSEKALKSLYDLIRKNAAGFNILIMVIKADRITQLMQNNYELFVSLLVNGKIPVILVVTRCENEKTLDSWPKNNKMHLDDYGMKFVTIIGSVWLIGQNSILESVYQQMRKESKEKVVEALSNFTLDRPNQISQSNIGNLIRKIYNFFARIFNWGLWMDTFEKLLQKIFGYSDKEAIEQASHYTAT